MLLLPVVADLSWTPPLTQDEYADASDPLPEGLIGNLKEFHVSYTEVGGVGCA